MHEAVLDRFAHASIVFMAAAVADYRPAHPAAEKIKKRPGDLTVTLERTVDILSDLGAQRDGQLLVGFAAETESVDSNAQRKLRDKGIDLIVANDVAGADTGFGVDTNAVTIFTRRGDREIVPLMSKDDVADRIIDAVLAFKRQDDEKLV